MLFFLNTFRFSSSLQAQEDAEFLVKVGEDQALLGRYK